MRSLLVLFGNRHGMLSTKIYLELHLFRSVEYLRQFFLRKLENIFNIWGSFHRFHSNPGLKVLLVTISDSILRITKFLLLSESSPHLDFYWRENNKEHWNDFRDTLLLSKIHWISQRKANNVAASDCLRRFRIYWRSLSLNRKGNLPLFLSQTKIFIATRDFIWLSVVEIYFAPMFIVHGIQKPVRINSLLSEIAILFRFRRTVQIFTLL